MHIVFTPSWPPKEEPASGIITYVSAMREILTQRDQQVSMVTLKGLYQHNDWHHLIRYKAPLRRRLKDRFDFNTGDRLAEILGVFHRMRGIDVIEMEESFGWNSDVAKLGIPLVVRLHGPHFLSQDFQRNPSKASKDREAKEGKALSSAKCVTSPSRRVMDLAFARYGCSNIHYIPNPVPTTERDWQLSSSRIVLWVGKINYAKGADIMLEAWEMLRHLGLKLSMVGPGSDFNASEGVTFLGRVERERLDDLRLKCALVVCTSRNEVLPYAITEAMALGCPVVSTNWPGVDDIISHGQTGWISPPEKLAATIEAALTSDRESVGAAAKSSMINRFSPEIVADQTLALYQQLVLDHRKRTSHSNTQVG
jgi:glycosyltransferase involved in cell wall biosynthesis